MSGQVNLAPARAGRSQNALAADALVGLRLVRIDGFEPAVALGESELGPYLRRFSLLFADDATMRRGGIGRVVRAVTAQGETVALKTLILPERGEFETDESHAALIEKFKAAFREEYECHRALSGLKGFPRLYGWGEVEGAPAIVMEWVEGETLSRLRPQLAVDGAGRLSPLAAARLGRDLFDLLCRMSLVGEGFVHRDISPANIMVRTARLSPEEQLAEGAFDLCLIDFGSSLALEPTSAAAGAAAKSFTERYATLRRATVAYAPPEMLSDDIAELRQRRSSPSIDVYAAASVVYELIAGAAPFDAAAEGSAGGSASRQKTRDLSSPYRLKMDTVPERPLGAHAAAEVLGSVLKAEPEVALAAAEQAQQLGLEPDSPELRDALAFVDEQLGRILMPCLASDQSVRPAPQDVEDALAGFCEQYALNIGRSLRGEPLAACPLGSHARAVRRAVAIALVAAAGALWLATAITAAALAAGTYARVAFAGLAWSGSVPGAVPAAALMLPGIAAIAVGAASPTRRAGFMHGTLALAACEVPVLALLACTAFWQEAAAGGLMRALAATFALAWFALAVGYAFEIPVAAPRHRDPSSTVPLVGGAAAVRAFAPETGTSHGAEESQAGLDSAAVAPSGQGRGRASRQISSQD